MIWGDADDLIVVAYGVVFALAGGAIAANVGVEVWPLAAICGIAGAWVGAWDVRGLREDEGRQIDGDDSINDRRRW